MKKHICLLSLIFVLLLTGCVENEREGYDWKFQIYYLNNAETKIESYELETNLEKPYEQVDALLTEMQSLPEKLEYKPPLGMNFKLLDYSFSDGCVSLNMDANYKELPVTTEVLVRAALVRTLTQVEGVDYVSITMENKPITDNLGNLIGMMSASQFIDNTGSEISTYETVKLKLYFASEDGTGLKEESRTIEYYTNISMEKLVIEELIKGPAGEDTFPVINPSTKTVSVSVQDGICYVNLDETFLTQIYNVSSDVTIYSIVNSLVELSNVNKVQISVNGVTDMMYRENVNLTTIFERNLDLIVK